MSHLSQKEVQERVEKISCFALVGLLAQLRNPLSSPFKPQERTQLAQSAIDIAIEMTFRLNAAFE